MQKFFLALALALVPPALAQAANSNLWHCSIRAKLKGDGDFFLRYGRDSFTGKGQMHCMNSVTAILVERTLDVSFNGADTGYGLNQSAYATIDLQMMTYHSPINFQFYSYVYNRAASPEISWRHDSGGMSVTVDVRPSGGPGVTRALQRGNLFIR